ncbi:N-formylglutamate amidohydrolase [Acidocella facilis]|uniref:N-formylglutamate amidohydrolase n=2 Tax=Acidocella facilis TaxID=525 RepID=UPI0005571A86|nr:N-formylglutamate amidohydrolase [Acidocella facilis]
MGLLQADEPPVYEILRPDGASPFLLTADHAGRAIPRALGDLGVGPEDMERHIAWDIGIAGVTRRLSAALDATAILQAYSRLVIDCNRQPHWASACPEISEATPIPGNIGLDEAGRAARRVAIFDPYHGAIGRMIAARPRTVYVAMHSFTPVYLDQARPMQVAVLYNRNPRLSKALASLLRDEGGLVVGENAPYRVSDESDYGVPVHAEGNGLDYLEIEIRQDLIADEAGQVEWAARLARLLPLALEALA